MSLDRQIEEQIKQLFKSWAHAEAETVNRMPQAGSARRYFRISGAGKTVIATWNPDIQENRAFIAFSRHFQENKLATPTILAVSEDESSYLQQDLGDYALYQDLPFKPLLLGKYQLVLAELARIQVLGGKDFPYEYAYPARRFDRDSMRWDLDYFKYFFLKLQEVPFDEQALEVEFNSLLDWLMEAPAWHFMLRDCQSRNIIFQEEKPWFIDFQAGREGPVAYDVASLLWQAKAEIPPDTRTALLEYYIGQLKRYIELDEAAFRDTYYGFVLHRNLQVLGAYGFRGLVQRKQHFIDSIPLALQNIQWLLQHIDFPVSLNEIKMALHQLYPKYPISTMAQNDDLKIRITSFSYKRGLPTDPSGNGGGFIFDCRSILNPGRFDAYKSLTGLDPSVQQFLLEESEIDTFLEPVFTLVDRAVSNYLERGFSNLQVSFGCTGGQHRSVYSSERLAAHLRQIPGVEVVLTHRERAHWPE
ncbi:MAG: phosphotransferase [Saprospiraceae bacterium]|nr:phosphotransferase [Saprospiraceae bacterium]